jgi:sialic acid synthase SpsE
MVDAIRITEKAVGKVQYTVTDHEVASRVFRRSLYIVQDMKKGDILTRENLRAIRPGLGLPPKYYDMLLGKHVKKDVKIGTPLQWDLI